MIALCAGMYRSCSTWQYQVVSYLVETALGGKRVGFWSPACLGELRDEAVDRRWRVIKVHEPEECFQWLLARREAVCFYTMRDLRDVVYSMMHKTGLCFDRLVIEQCFVERLIDHDRFWRSQPGVVVQRYEEIVASPMTSTGVLAETLGLTIAPVELAALSDEYSIEANRARTARLAGLLKSQGVDLTDPENVQKMDAFSQLHWNHIRAGAVGSWRHQATTREAEILADKCIHWLVDNGYSSL